MFQNYQLKWCFILISILAVSTGIVKAWDFQMMHPSLYVGHILSISIFVLIAWLIIAYFKQNSIAILSRQANSVLSIVLSMIVTLLVNYLIVQHVPTSIYLPDPPYEPTIPDFVRRLVGSFLLTMICYIVYNTLFTNDILQQTQLENQEFKQAHLRAQLLSLQQQISPHFLFNSLSTLKNVTNESDTKKYVVQLSHVYRYLLSINEHQTTTLAEELKFINAYLYILNVRFENALNVTINIPNDFCNYLIPPLSLQLLIENAIKHNVASFEHPLHIEIYINEQQELVVNNPYQPKNIPVESTKLGLKNINDRYRLLFNREIIIDQTEANFTILLPLISHESYHH